jgi:microcystin-dependent protein
MNKLNFIQTGGFRLRLERLNEMQEAYSLFNALGYLGGDKTIIYGCTVQGANTGDGFVFLNGEVFPFKGGTTIATVKIIEEVTSREFQDGQTKPVHLKRYVTFASGSNTIPWVDFIRLNPLKEIQRRILPPGTNPQLYRGSIANIPEGWQLCDGTNGTDDLRGMFLVGYDPNNPDYDEIGKTGGTPEVILTTAQMPSHQHEASTNSAGAHTHTAQLVDETGSGTFAGGAPGGASNGTGTTASAGAHTHSVSVGNTGGDEAHENRPPYYTLAYIIYIG